MKINVGTKNEAKIKAVKETLSRYDLFREAEIIGVPAKSKVSDQPLSLEETVKGAKNRAKNSFKDCDYSLGIESGLMEIPDSKKRYVNFCVVAIYDGKDFHLGLSSAFEIPKKVFDLVKKKGLTLTDACMEAGLSEDSHLGEKGGLISILTDGKVTRQLYIEGAIMMALVSLQNPHLYSSQK